MALEFSEDSMREYILDHGGRVKNIELVTHFKAFLNDPDRTDEMRERFKQHVNTLATVKVDDQKEKIVVLKKKYRSDSGGGNHDIRARSEPPLNTVSDNTDGTGQSRVRSDGNLSGSPLRTSGSSSTLTSTTSTTNDSLSLGSAVSSSSLSSGDPDDVNASIISVKERAKHLNRIESESEIQKVSSSNLGAVRKKEGRKNRDADGDDSSTSSGYEPIGPIEREWLVKCSSSDYHLMHELLSKNPQLAAVKDYTSGYTALHWAAMHGRVEVIKMLMSKSRVNVNQRTGYTPLHLAAIQGHEAIIEILVNAFKADPNIRDYSGKKAKQYLRNSASSRAQQLLVSNRLSSKSVGYEKSDGGFMRNSGSRRSNRDSAIRSLIRASTGAMKQTAIRSGWGSTEDVSSGNTTPRSSPSPRNSAEPSPNLHRRKGSFKGRDGDLMPPPSSGSVPFRNKQRSSKHSQSKESLHSEEKQLSLSKKQVPRSESEPNLGEAVQPSKSTFI
ncbi:hypothetical protein ACF0H5_006141 [Mactra antiquata]